MSDVVNKWLRLKYPEQFNKKVQEAVQRAVEKALLESGVVAEAEHTGSTVNEVIDKRELAAWEFLINQHDDALLDALDLSIPRFVELIRQEGARARGGTRIAAHLSNSLDLSLAAFLEVEREGGTFTDAVNRAQEATVAENPQPSVATLRNWLNKIVGKSWCSIPSPPRGRPKKNNN